MDPSDGIQQYTLIQHPLYGRLNNYNNVQEEAESEKSLTYTLSVSGLTAIPGGLVKPRILAIS